ncbi:MAG: ribosomal protein S18-alanine N-acetyltransferase [Desulfobacteraceae bacterium]|nr:ribosomal protein S18-alanine N-acetyltransferase [Desulfobacteraceae bacterium]
MGIDITISFPVKADIPAILQIELDSQPEPWSERSFLEELARIHSYLLVARIEDADKSGDACLSVPSGTIVGYICFWSVADEIQILNIAVAKGFRRRGIGCKLIEYTMRTAGEKHARCVNLEVRKSNAEAIALYRSFGFKAVGERPNYYCTTHNEPAVLMELELETVKVG